MKLHMLVLPAVLLAFACDAEQPEKKDSSTETSSAGVKGDDAQASAPDAAAESDGGCKDLRHPTDGLQPGDDCWDPPLHYCSEGWGAGGAVACSPDGSLCCRFPAYCYPCGWESCNWDEDEGCPNLYETGDEPEECQQWSEGIQPETEICWDGLAPPR